LTTTPAIAMHGTVIHVTLRVLGVVWASPYTLLGLLLGAIGLATGGRARVCARAVEFHGGAVAWLLGHMPGGQFPVAMTLGHVILGRSAAALDLSREHEHVHIRQFERWGPLMGPAYLGCSAVLWLRGRRPYLDNPFEKEAYRQ
jgi:hypothetical protein